ncbi:TPA: DUF1642 domain-containing protein [Enterococcus faecalis]
MHKQEQLEKSYFAVLPKTVNEFIKEGLKRGGSKEDIIDLAFSFSEARPKSEFSEWFKSNEALFVEAISNGYEIEQGTLYHVLLPDRGGAKVGGYTFLNSRGEIDFTTSKEKLDLLTEQEIRAIDARYWSFAVKVEE